MTPPVLDIPYLRSITDGDRTMEREFFRLFRQTALRCLSRLRASTEKEDASLWDATLHELKGAAGYLGARRIQHLCQQAREIKKEKRLTLLASLEEEMRALEACMKHLCRED